MVWDCDESWTYVEYNDHISDGDGGQLHGILNDGTCVVPSCPYGTSDYVYSISCGYSDTGGGENTNDTTNNGSDGTSGGGGSSSNDGNDNTEEENVDLNDGHGLDAAPAVEEDLNDNNNLCQEIDVFKMMMYLNKK